MRPAAIILALASTLTSATAVAQTTEVQTWAVNVGLYYRMIADIAYTESDSHESKLDVIVPGDRSKVHPTLLFIHGGGWVGGNKETQLLRLLPFLEMGYAVVNVEYRLADVALAPAAVEDTRCALRWLRANAEEYGFDTDRIVVSGASAGGHLALTTGMLPAAAGFDRRCPATRPAGDGVGPGDAYEPEMPVAAVINWFGITDVGDLLAGDNAKTYAVAWFGGIADRMNLASRVSPLTYVRPGLPPILTIHGDADTIVPYAHGVRLHEALLAAGDASQLHTVAGGGHGNFTREQFHEVYDVIRAFLATHVTGERATTDEQ